MRLTSDSVGCEGWIAIEQAEVAPGSGDCVHVVTRVDGSVVFFLADVAGHDARAAQFARALDALVSELAATVDPGALLGALNENIRYWPPDLFVSAVCFSLDPATGNGSIAVAGQLPPVVKGFASTRTVGVQGGPPLGVFGGQVYVEQQFEVAAGELLVATTDGVTDPLAACTDLLGVASLSRILEEGPAEPADACATLLSAARRAGLWDDATVLAVAPARHAARALELGIARRPMRSWVLN
jgi:serine phosphatase RsbU (regulator of sigma subunit)